MSLKDSTGILTTDDVCLAVREAGFALGPEDISLDPRDERLAVALPGGGRKVISERLARNKMNKEQVIAKFYTCVDGRLTTRQAEAIISTVYDLDMLPSARDLTRLLAPGGVQGRPGG